MAQNKYAKNAKEFDKRFDSGEDITGLVDLKTAKVYRPGKKVRITLDMAEDLVKEIDRIKEKIGVDRGALIKVWIHERVQQEKSGKKQSADYTD